ncbi:MAG: nitrate ABC transporter substrate-binding protein, partial [Pseudomonadota bacterium]|nr:nitrate ABC transporter substrate-binding protein [Pseudomonadota bacterium]
MPEHSAVRRQVLHAALAATVPLAVPGMARAVPAPLVVGGLPVTCNLTLPVTCVAKAAALRQGGGQPVGFEYAKYSGWA